MAEAAGREPSNLAGWARAYELARIDAADAQARVRYLQRQLPSRGRLWLHYKSSPEYQQALKELADSRRAYEAVRQQVVKDLAAKAEYQKALAMRKELDQRLETARVEGNQETLRTLAERKLEYAGELSRLEARALAGNNKAQGAMGRLNDTRQQLQRMERQFDPLAQHPELRQVMEQLEAARQEYAGASRQLSGLEAGYRQALVERVWESRPRNYYGSYWNYRPWYYYRVDPYYKFRAIPQFPYGWNFNVMGLFNQGR